MFYLFFKYKFYLGFWDAFRVFIQMKIFKKRLKVSFIKFPFYINFGNVADNQTFNEVILKNLHEIGSSKCKNHN